MARIGGRNSFIAVPVGLLCAAVVGVLVWYALPMGPVVTDWAGNTLRSAFNPEVEAAEPVGVGSRAEDCRSLYPTTVWTELTWTSGALLSQGYTAPATSETALIDAVTPTVQISCSWVFDGDRSVSTTLSAIPEGAVPIAEIALRGQGFTCTTDAATLACSRLQGDVFEEHAFRDGLWLASIEDGLHLDAYGARMAQHVWE
ncbi:hypothetical protein LG299_13755 [Microbacterium lacus]|uniref:hypothetical protein n=1 Tax=Microbacterium lacus TaxID=415217 RepID=UPI0038514589